MDSRGNEDDDSGSIELKTIKETDTESRKSSIANEETGEDTSQAKEKTDLICIPAKTIIWKTFKIIVFLICVTLLVIQSVEFYNIYSEYPTNMVQQSTFMKEVKLPAVTLCFKYAVSTMRFCYDNPDWCVKPNNSEEFCQKHGFFCNGDISNLTDNLNIINEIDDGSKQVDSTKKYGLSQSRIANFLKKKKQIDEAVNSNEINPQRKRLKVATIENIDAVILK
ncbi:hypothetical protein AVEN_25353-1 [Araneus ventricosus]|uniref:HTH psq-type domain-containing protein n=1 Tax=Araneus ventricosus TaxID=182803 RepID=A0A4Y2EIQ8_ARAVE|nr:hypothetical protein AVEN_25353-1 [Araneus ventricosus]